MKIGIIGAGNIGGSMIEGFVRSESVSNADLYVSDLAISRLQTLQQVYEGINVTTSNVEVARTADVLILAVKPWLVESVVEEILSEVKAKIVVSVAAGVDLAQLELLFEKSAKSIALFRMIPNTAIAIGKGVLTISYKHKLSDEAVEVEHLFAALGEVFVVPEKQLNAFMSLSSCGIAYAFRYIRAAVEGAVEMGIGAEVAQNVVAQTMIGAAELLQEKSSHPEVEIDKVTTPGGITIKGLNEMEANGFTSSVIKGLKASLIK